MTSARIANNTIFATVDAYKTFVQHANAAEKPRVWKANAIV
jgi:hypothetical protein